MAGTKAGKAAKSKTVATGKAAKQLQRQEKRQKSQGILLPGGVDNSTLNAAASSTRARRAPQLLRPLARAAPATTRQDRTTKSASRQIEVAENLLHAGFDPS